MKRPAVLVVRNDGIFSSLLRDAGCEVLNLELIKTVPADDLSDLDQALARIDNYDGLFFTSPAAAEVFAEQSIAAGRIFSGKTYALGERAQTVLENSGFEVVQAADANTAEDLIAAFDKAEFLGKKLLFVRGDKSLRTIPHLLLGRADVDEVIVYETREVLPDEALAGSITQQLSSGEIDWICFFSPSGVQAFRKLFAVAVVGNIKTAAVGETTASEIRKSQLDVTFVSQRPTAKEFAVSLIEHFKEH